MDKREVQFTLRADALSARKSRFKSYGTELVRVAPVRPTNAPITPRDGMIVRVGKRRFAKLTVS